MLSTGGGLPRLIPSWATYDPEGQVEPLAWSAL